MRVLYNGSGVKITRPITRVRANTISLRVYTFTGVRVCALYAREDGGV